jgi:PBCV-specific basic adaptor domain
MKKTLMGLFSICILLAGMNATAQTTASKDSAAKAAKKAAKAEAKAEKAKASAATTTATATAPKPATPTTTTATAAPATASAKTPAQGVNKSADKVIGTDAKGRTIYQGPKGGQYTLTPAGNKEYIKKPSSN